MMPLRVMNELAIGVRARDAAQEIQVNQVIAQVIGVVRADNGYLAQLLRYVTQAYDWQEIK